MTASTAKQEVRPTPRGTHPNSLANLQKGKATQFGNSGAIAAKEAQEKSVESRTERRTLKEGLLLLINEQLKDKDGKATDKTTQDAIIAGLVKRAVSGDTRAFEIIRDTIGEKPIEKVANVTPEREVVDGVEKALFGQ